jgi:hypothetical protein
MYIGCHRRVRKRNPWSHRSLSTALFVVVSTAVLAPTALGSGRPRSCTGVPPTAITIQQTFVALDGGVAAGFTYLVSTGAAFDPDHLVANAELVVASGQTLSTIVTGLSKGGYTVHQVPDPSSGIAPAPDRSVTVAPPACVEVVSYTNIIEAV